MTGGNLKESEVEAEEASGKGRERRWEQPGGPLIHCLLAVAGQGSSRHGKSPVGALLSAGAVRLCGL